MGLIDLSPSCNKSGNLMRDNQVFDLLFYLHSNSVGDGGDSNVGFYYEEADVTVKSEFTAYHFGMSQAVLVVNFILPSPW